ncbi:MAG TPA: 3-oxoacyl-ACP reductase FabG [Flavipsychrobacter sp.]|nr:3-oxoacyl-ACP reductase FabG [Flavipsychrobacter sp.]
MKYALVTGGSRGIGKLVCVKLAELGYNILINYKGNQAAAADTEHAVKACGVSAELLQFDVADKAEVDRVITEWQDNHPDDLVEVLVNNAGVRQDTLMMSMTDSQWSDVLNTSLQGMYNVTKSVLNKMLMNRYGRIINMVSLSGLKGTPGQVNYSAAKAGMIGATKALAQEIAKRNVTVNAVAPGFVKTDMTEELNEKELAKMIPMNRFGEAEEVADLVQFLASPKASYITGQVISINGGLYS